MLYLNAELIITLDMNGFVRFACYIADGVSKLFNELVF